MIYYAISSAAGVVVRWGQAQDEAQALAQAHADEVVHTSAQPVPSRPSPAFQFNAQAWQWSDPRTPERQVADVWQQVRAQRDRTLAACDWTQLPDVPHTVQRAWQAYRQALRDITQQPDPFKIEWPEQPNGDVA